jgi:hypothetical protein
MKSSTSAARKTQTFRIEVFDANKTLEAVAIAGLGIRSAQRYDLSDSNGTTTVSIRITVRTRGLFRLLEPLLPKMITAKWRNYGDRLRGLLENQPVVKSTKEIDVAAQLRQLEVV